MERCTEKSHEMAKAIPSLWGAMEFVGYQEDVNGRPAFECRNCPRCHSTLYVELRTHNCQQAVA